MKADECGSCGDPISDEWIALDSFGPVAEVAIVCRICAPIVERIDGLVKFGHLEVEAAAAMFEELRWGKSDARSTRGDVVGLRDVPGVQHGGPGSPELPSPAIAPCAAT